MARNDAPDEAFKSVDLGGGLGVWAIPGVMHGRVRLCPPASLPLGPQPIKGVRLNKEAPKCWD